MTRHEAAQNRAFEEIVAAVGQNQLPGLQDRHSLPFVESLIHEVYRFHPAVPLVTHSNFEEETFQGFRIPTKSWILANVWYSTLAIAPLFTSYTLLKIKSLL